jgi:hypothetical protein
MSGEEHKEPDGKPVSGITPPPEKLKPNSGTSPAPASSTNKFPPVGSGSAKGPASTGKFMPVGSGTNKFAPVGGGQGTGKFAPVGPRPNGSTGKFTPVGSGAPPRPASPPPSAAPEPSKFAQIPVPVKKPPSGLGTPPKPDNKAVTSTGSFSRPDTKAVTSTGSFSKLDPARPRSAPPPGASGSRLTLGDMTNLTVPQKGGAKPGSQWICSSCGKALNPQSVMQGAAMVIDGSLKCVECIKGGGSRRGKEPVISGKMLLIAGASLVAILGVVGIFLPSQVLLIVLLISIAAILVGLIGFTLSGIARLGTVAGGLCMLILSIFGLVTVRERAEEKSAENTILSQSDTIRQELNLDRINEVQVRISAIEDKANKSSDGHPTAAVQKSIGALRALVDEWVNTNFGQVNAAEKKLLFDLFHRFGSVTPGLKSRAFRAIKFSGTHLSLTAAYDPPVTSEDVPRDELRTLISRNGDLMLDHAQSILQCVCVNAPKLENVDFRIVSAAKDAAELYANSFTAEEIKGFTNGHLEPLKRNSQIIKTGQ